MEGRQVKCWNTELLKMGLFGMVKNGITPNIRGECVVAPCRAGEEGTTLPCLPPLLSQEVGCVLSPVDFGVALRGCCPCLPTLPPAVPAPQFGGLDTHPWLPVMMGLLHPQGAAFEVHKAHIMRGGQPAEGKNRSQAGQWCRLR